MAKKSTQPRVYTEIIIKAPDRKTHDVGEWRTALRSADMGRTRPLFDLYDDLLIDGLLADAVEKRILAVLNSQLTFQNKEGEDVPEITEIIKSNGFEELLRTIMNRIIWGRSGGEFDFSTGFAFHPFPAKHVSIETKSILRNTSDVLGIPYDGDDHLLVLGKKGDFGLLLKAAPYAIWKRGGFGDYAQWLEIFGMPQRVGKYSSYDVESRKLLLQAMEQAGSAPYIIIPKETEVETTNNTGTGGSGSAHNDFRKACNEEILITLLGQTLTTTQNDTGARSLGEVQRDVQNDKHKADIRMTLRVLNEEVRALLEKRGFPVAGGQFVFPESVAELSVSDIVQLADILPIPQSYLHKKYSIPSPDNGEPIARKEITAAGSDVETQGVASPPDKPDKPIKNADKGFWKGLFSFFVAAPTSSSVGATGNHPITINLADIGEFGNDELIKRVAAGESLIFDNELFEWTAANLIKAFRTGWAKSGKQLADGFDYGLELDAAKEIMELNLFQFSTAKDIAETYMLNKLFRDSTGFDDFYAKAQKELQIWQKTWMQTEYNSALLVAEQSETYYRLDAQKDLFPYWMYKTQDDGRVRYSHVKLNGAMIKADNEVWEKIYPPNDWNCRCYVVPRMENEVTAEDKAEGLTKANEYIKSAVYKRSVGNGWGRNRAKIKQVFTADQMYIKKFPRGAKAINKLDYTHWGLDSTKKLMEQAKSNLQRYAGTAADWWDKAEKANDTALFTDYNGRRLNITSKNFDRHTTGSRENRTAYLNALDETLKEPDEIWVTGENTFDSKTLIKYYNNEAVVVICEVAQGKIGGAGSYKVKTWFPLTMKKQTIQKYRAGVLVKKYPGS